MIPSCVSRSNSALYAGFFFSGTCLGVLYWFSIRLQTQMIVTTWKSTYSIKYILESVEHVVFCDGKLVRNVVNRDGGLCLVRHYLLVYMLLQCLYSMCYRSHR